MYKKLRNPLNRGQKSKTNNKMQDEAKVGSEWVN